MSHGIDSMMTVDDLRRRIDEANRILDETMKAFGEAYDEPPILEPREFELMAFTDAVATRYTRGELATLLTLAINRLANRP